MQGDEKNNMKKLPWTEDQRIRFKSLLTHFMNEMVEQNQFISFNAQEEVDHQFTKEI